MKYNECSGRRTSRVSRRTRSIRTVRRHDGRASRCPEVARASPPAGMAQESGRQSKSARLEAQGRDRYRAAKVRQLKRLVVRVASQFRVSEPLAHNLRNRKV